MNLILFGWLRKLKEDLQVNFYHYFVEEYHNRTDINETLRICSFLDPRYKDLLFLKPNMKEEIIALVQVGWGL